MLQNFFRNIGGPAGGSSVSVADVERVRRQRRRALTSTEQAEVRAHLRTLAGDVRSEPGLSSQYLKNVGIALIVIGLVIGLALCYAAFIAWPLYIEMMES